MSADKILEELGGIAGLLQTLAGVWPLELAEFEAVFDLVVRRCRNELGAGRFLAYLCRALLHEQAYQEIRRTVPPLEWALAAERVKHAAAEAFQAPSFADDVASARGLAEAVHDPGSPVFVTLDGRVLPETDPKCLARRERLAGWILEMQLRAALAVGKKLLRRPRGARHVKGVKRPRNPSNPDPAHGLDRLRQEMRAARGADRLEPMISSRLGLDPADAAKVAEWKNPDRIAAALSAAELDPSLVGKGLAAIRAAERNVRARARRWGRLRERQKTDTHLSRAQK